MVESFPDKRRTGTYGIAWIQGDIHHCGQHRNQWDKVRKPGNRDIQYAWNLPVGFPQDPLLARNRSPIRVRSWTWLSQADNRTLNTVPLRTGHSAAFDLQSLADFRNLTSLPIVPKGIRTAADALTCLKLGFPAIYVSNHGGRTIDGAPTAVEILLDIRRNAPEVFEKMEVYADGGVRRGNHVITLLALGAKAVGLGRSPIFANVWGEEGVLKMINLLETELRTTMLLMGESNVNNINSSYVSKMWPS